MWLTLHNTRNVVSEFEVGGAKQPKILAAISTHIPFPSYVVSFIFADADADAYAYNVSL